MKARCNNSSTTNYHRYGGRGIKVCERWNKDFKYFYDDMIGTYFDGAELDRIDNNGNYEPNNCRWVTHKENSNNRINITIKLVILVCTINRISINMSLIFM